MSIDQIKNKLEEFGIPVPADLEEILIADSQGDLFNCQRGTSQNGGNIDTYSIAYSGTHGTGKTTSVLETAQRFKKECPDKTVGVLMENIAKCPFPINGNTTDKSQLWIFSNQLQCELEMMGKYDVLISDRTIVDCIAYTRYAGFVALADGMELIASKHFAVYNKIVFKKTETNSYHFEDGFRDGKNDKFRTDIEQILLETYYRIGSGPVHPNFEFK